MKIDIWKALPKMVKSTREYFADIPERNPYEEFRKWVEQAIEEDKQSQAN